MTEVIKVEKLEDEIKNNCVSIILILGIMASLLLAIVPAFYLFEESEAVMEALKLPIDLTTWFEINMVAIVVIYGTAMLMLSVWIITLLIQSANDVTNLIYAKAILHVADEIRSQNQGIPLEEV